MSGISSGTGLFSGIDTQSLIQQLLSIESRPKLLVQSRVAQLQRQQAALLDINSQLGSLKSAASALRLNDVFKSAQAVSSDPEVLTATASTGAVPGSYSFTVAQLVTSQQWLSRGFADASTAGQGATSFTFESAQSRLDRDTALADLNGGDGVRRGTIIISDADGASATIDLSTAATVGEVLEAITGATGVAVTASVEGGKLVVSHDEGKAISIVSGHGYETAASLGIEQATAAGSTVTGSDIYYLAESTALNLLNDGNGVYIGDQVGESTYDFTITVGGTAVNVNLGEVYEMVDGELEPTASAVTTLEGVLGRINDALEATLGDTDIQASIDASGTGLKIVDSQGRTIEVAENASTGGSTAADLGLLTSGPATGTLTGRRVLAGLNSTLARTLNGGAGIAGDGSIAITGRDGLDYSVTIDTSASLQEILDSIGTQTGGKITASLDERGTGIVLRDTTGGAGNLIVAGETAGSLGIATEAGGVAADRVSSGNLQHQYITLGTTLESLNGGKGTGTGTFRITDSTGASKIVDIGSTDTSLNDVIRDINSRGLRVQARINDNGDGIELYEPDDGAGGAVKIKIEDVTGSVAKSLGILGEAPGTGAENVIDGSAEHTVEFEPTDTLEQIASKINAAGVGLSAAVINDGAGSTPYRLSFTASGSGTAGRMVIDTGSFDLGISMLEAGRDAKVFFGSSDPAQAVLLRSSTNVIDGVIQGVSIDLRSASEDPVTLTVSQDTAAIETAVGKFVDTFNAVIEHIAAQSRYTQETNSKGPLLGDSTVQTLRASMYSTIQADGEGLTGRYDNLAQVGVTVGSGGKLTLDRDALRAALAEDPEAVADVFAARTVVPPEEAQDLGEGITVNDPDADETFSVLGVAAMVEELVKSYTDSIDGVMTTKTKGIDEQIKQQNARIAALDVRLESRRQVLERQFLAMEQAIAQLQGAQSSLSSIQLVG